jgi:hypothetical protein
MADIPVGMTVTVAADIVVNGVLAFGRGEQVVVRQVSPDPQRPEYRYAVMSARTGTWYQLRDADIMPPFATQPQQQPYVERRRRYLHYRAGPIIGVLAGASGIIMIISTFLAWISGRGVTGWSMMFSRGFGTAHNFLFSTGASKIVFTGFWSLLFGILVIAGAVTLLTGWGGANGLVLTGGILGFTISVVSIIMIYSVKPIAIAPGPGLWLFAVFSLIAAVAGGVGASQARYADEG